MNVVLLGPPGAGKGTQAGLLANRWGIPHISSGNLVREAVSQGTPVGRELQGYMERGALVPDGLMTRMVLDRLDREGLASGFLLDGFPRTRSQAEELEAWLQARTSHVDVALYFATSAAVIIRRLSGRRVCPQCGAIYHLETLKPVQTGRCDRCGVGLVIRPDDAPETVQRRLRVYETESAPLMAYYETRGVLQRVNGDAEAQALSAEIERQVRRRGLAIPGEGCHAS